MPTGSGSLNTSVLVEEQTPNAVRVVAVDDHPVVIGALRSWGRSHGRIEVLAQFTTGDGVAAAVRANRPDLVLVDYDIPGTDTIALIESLSSEGAKVVILSGFIGADVVMACLDAGACGYLCKDNDMAVIASLLERAAHGEFVTCESVKREMGRNT